MRKFSDFETPKIWGQFLLVELFHCSDLEVIYIEDNFHKVVEGTCVKS